MAGGILLQSGATSGNGNVFNCRGYEGRYELSVVGVGTISAGAVQWEHALDPAYSGTWKALGAPITPVSGEVVTQVFEGVVHYVRARFSTAVSGSGGAATVRMQPPKVAGIR